jgi:hypothetical protein
MAEFYRDRIRAGISADRVFSQFIEFIIILLGISVCTWANVSRTSRVERLQPLPIVDQLETHW